MINLKPFALAGMLLTPAAGQAGYASMTDSNEDSDQPDRPNIIFIIADDMTPDMFNFLPEGEGRNLTPALDQLTREGTVLRNQYSVSPVSTPSRFNCLTGLYASRATNSTFVNQTRSSGGQTVVRWNSHITPQTTTLPGLLQENGYVTGAVGKNHVIEVPNYYKAPWDADPTDPEIKEKLEANAQILRKAYRKGGFDYAERIYHENPDFNGCKELAVHNMDWIAEGGIQFIEQNKDRPFFLYFATTLPHGPGEKHRSWGADRRKTPLGYLEEPMDLLSGEQEIEQRLEDADLELSSWAFNRKANLLWMDDAVGVLMKKLRDLGIAENTIVFFFNDHGQNAKGTIYQGGIKNPSLVWKAGGFATGDNAYQRVSNVDFAPTILDMAGAEVSGSRFDGKSFLPALKGDPSPIHESLYFEMGYTRGVIKGDSKYIALRYPEFARNMSLEERKRRLERLNSNLRRRGFEPITEDPTEPFSHNSIIPGGGHAEHGSTGEKPGYYDKDQLYNLRKDPRELHNLADDPQYRDELKQMKQELKEYIEDLPGHFGSMGKSKSETCKEKD